MELDFWQPNVTSLMKKPVYVETSALNRHVFVVTESRTRRPRAFTPAEEDLIANTEL